MSFFRIIALTICAALVSVPARALDPVLVYAAASTQPVIDALIPVLKSRGLDVTPVYGGSATLARQIELGAGADVYITANARWMDYLAARDLIDPATRQDIATNQLVLIAHEPLPAPQMVFGPGYPLAAVLGDGRLAMAAPDYVPAGQYGKQALQHLGAWDAVKDRLAPTKDVTGALMLVARGEARLGVVYLSDLGRTDQVQIFQPFSADSHDPIVYQAAIINRPDDETKGQDDESLRAFLDVLLGPEGQAAFRAAGFGGKP